MGIRTKTLVTVLLVGAVVGILVITTQNKELFKGQIFGEKEVEEVTTTERVERGEELLPDLMPQMEIIQPNTPEEDIVVNVTIENVGEGSIEGGQPFKYTISIDGVEVFSNSDSFSALEPGDAFSFKYPIPRSIYQYTNTGEVELVLDSENSIKESSEDNNILKKKYDF